jgi:DNA topoisomerase-1
LDGVEEGKDNRVHVLSDFYEPFAQLLIRAQDEMKDVEYTPEETGEICEKCGRMMIYRYGKSGKFIACPGYPECRNTRNIVEHIGVDCPDCKKGKIVVRKGKKRTFFGCTEYPTCNFVSWERPLRTPCPTCSSVLVQKREKGQLKAVCGKCNFSELLEVIEPEDKGE